MYYVKHCIIDAATVSRWAVECWLNRQIWNQRTAMLKYSKKLNYYEENKQTKRDCVKTPYFLKKKRT